MCKKNCCCCTCSLFQWLYKKCCTPSVDTFSVAPSSLTRSPVTVPSALNQAGSSPNGQNVPNVLSAPKITPTDSTTLTAQQIASLQTTRIIVRHQRHSQQLLITPDEMDVISEVDETALSPTSIANTEVGANVTSGAIATTDSANTKETPIKYHAKAFV